MAFFRVILLAAAATALPMSQFSGYGQFTSSSGSSSSLSSSSFGGSSSGGFTSGALSYHVPEGCTFLSSSQVTEGNLIKGEYSYEDPVGSIITVTYTVNVDGTNYQEKRKIVKGYETDANTGFKVSDFSTQALLTADDVVNQVISELKTTVIQIIRLAVEQSSINLNDQEGLVQTIMIQLRPVVSDAVSNALATSQHQHLEESVLINRIIAELTPFVREGVRKEIQVVQIQTQTPTISEDQVVKTVIDELKQTVIRIIRATVQASDVSTSANQESLVQTIMVQLRPVVSQAVQNAPGFSSSRLDASSLINRIIVELTPFVRTGVQQEVQVVQQQNQATARQVVKQVIQQLSPFVTRVITETVRNYQGDLSKYDNLVQQIIDQLKPVIEQNVQQALSTSTNYQNLNANSVTELLLVEIRPFIMQGVEAQIKVVEAERLEQNSEKVVRIVIEELRPIVVRVITETVNSYTGDLNKYGDLVEAISAQLRPIVLSEVSQALSTSTKYGGLNAQELAQEIIVELRPFIQQGVREQVRIKEQQVAQQLQVSHDEVVQIVTRNLQQIVFQVIRETVRSSNIGRINENDLVNQITIQLRPVVLSSVQNAISSSTKYSGLNANELTDEIIVQLTPSIRRGVQQEIQEIKQEQGVDVRQVVSTITTKLRPTIIRIIRATVASSNVDLTNEEQLVQTISSQMRPVVLREVQNALKGSSTTDANSLVEQIMIQLTPIIREGTRVEVQKVQQAATISEADLIEKIILQLRPIIEGIVKQQLSTTSIQTTNGGNINTLITEIITKLRPVITTTVHGALGSKPAATVQSSGNLVSGIISQLRPFITNSVQNVLNSQQTTTLSSTQTTQVTNGFLANLRPIIQRAVVTVMTRLNGQQLSEEQLIARVNSEAEGGAFVRMLEIEIRGVLGSGAALPSQDAIAQLLLELRPQIRQMIIEEIRIYRQQNEISAAVEAQLTSSVVGQLRSTVKTTVSQTLQGGATGSDAAIAEQIMGQLRASIVSTLQSEMRAQGITVSTSAQSYQNLLQLIMEQIRTIIIQEITIYRQQQVPTTTTTDTKNSVTSIFGISGVNSVRVQTPTFNYQWETK